jgi:hypothetical protein
MSFDSREDQNASFQTLLDRPSSPSNETLFEEKLDFHKRHQRRHTKLTYALGALLSLSVMANAILAIYCHSVTSKYKSLVADRNRSDNLASKLYCESGYLNRIYILTISLLTCYLPYSSGARSVGISASQVWQFHLRRRDRVPRATNRAQQ